MLAPDGRLVPFLFVALPSATVERSELCILMPKRRSSSESSTCAAIRLQHASATMKARARIVSMAAAAAVAAGQSTDESAVWIRRARAALIFVSCCFAVELACFRRRYDSQDAVNCEHKNRTVRNYTQAGERRSRKYANTLFRCESATCERQSARMTRAKTKSLRAARIIGRAYRRVKTTLTAVLRARALKCKSSACDPSGARV